MRSSHRHDGDGWSLLSDVTNDGSMASADETSVPLFLQAVLIVQVCDPGGASIAGMDYNAIPEANRLSRLNGHASVLSFISGEIAHPERIRGKQAVSA